MPDRWMLKYGRQQARCAVFMQMCAHLARNGQQELAQKWLAKADAAAANVRLEDFVVAKPNAAEPSGERRCGTCAYYAEQLEMPGGYYPCRCGMHGAELDLPARGGANWCCQDWTSRTKGGGNG